MLVFMLTFYMTIHCPFNVSGESSDSCLAIIDGRFKVIDDEINAGGFGRILQGFEMNTNKGVAVKTAKYENPAHVEMLKAEAEVLDELQGIEGVPKLYFYGYEEDIFYLVMDQLRVDLFEDYEFDAITFNDAALVGQKIVKVLEGMHDKGYLHLDIKPENIMKGFTGSDIYLVDYGGSKRFINENREHVQKKKIKSQSQCITSEYASINMLRNIQPSRKDDLLMLGYTLLDMFGFLPWRKQELTPAKMCQARMELLRDESVFADLPQMKEYLQYCTKLEFAARPNYEYLQSLFESLLEA